MLRAARAAWSDSVRPSNGSTGLRLFDAQSARLPNVLDSNDPATVDLGQLSRTPLPRVEGEVKFDLKDVVHLFTNGFWQVLEGTLHTWTRQARWC